MNILAEFHFIRPAWLLLAPIVVGLWWLGCRSRDPLRGWRTAMDRELLEAFTVGDPQINRWREVSLLAGWLLALVAVAGPTWRPEPSPFADDPVPVMLVLRAAESMDQADLLPSRMERARLKVADFAAERKGQPLGLVVYAGSPHLVLPPTRDTDVVAKMAAEISPEIMPKPGDDLVGAIELATRTLGDAGGSIVVMTDTAAEASNEFALLRETNRVPIHFLAVARAETPEVTAIQRAATELSADVQLMTPDLEDVRSLVRRTATAPVAVGVAGEGVRWAEAGWWLVPLITLLSLTTFRREQPLTTGET